MKLWLLLKSRLEKGIEMNVKFDGEKYIYHLCGKDYTESEMYVLYNDYCVQHGKNDYLIYTNGLALFDSYHTREELARDIADNSRYHLSEPYATFEHGKYLVSGELDGVINVIIYEEMIDDIIKGVYDA